MVGTLTEYKLHYVFKTQIGVFKQIDGLPMGGCLSPIIANIFVNMLEDTVVKKFVKQGKIKFWKRYADDIISIAKKDSTDQIFNKLNSWDPSLNFTIVKMVENSLIFLESEIFISNNSIEFKYYRKFGQKTILSNFKNSKMSKKYLKANIITQCNNVLDACSTYEYFCHVLMI